ncbi:MAG: hypothetical protein IPG04_40680 [Polyangiaceae bacterium]|nr:hypothetical protein [Polyangiaceae bacterium]
MAFVQRGVGPPERDPTIRGSKGATLTAVALGDDAAVEMMSAALALRLDDPVNVEQVGPREGRRP